MVQCTSIFHPPSNIHLQFPHATSPLAAARYAIIAHVVHLVNRDYMAMCYDYYT